MSIFDFPRQPSYPVNDESLTQSNDDVFKIAQDMVNLAVEVLTQNPVRSTWFALAILYCYADWKSIKLPRELKRTLYVANYGEDEVQAMEEAGEIEY